MQLHFRVQKIHRCAASNCPREQGSATPVPKESVKRGRDSLLSSEPILQWKLKEDTGEVGSMVRDEAVGIVTGEEPEAFVEGIDRLLRDEDSRREMGRRARRLAETKLSWRFLAGRLVELYQELLTSAGAEG